MKKKSFVVIFALTLAWLTPLYGAEIEIHGDLNHRFKYTNHADFAKSDQKGVINDGSVGDFTQEITKPRAQDIQVALVVQRTYLGCSFRCLGPDGRHPVSGQRQDGQRPFRQEQLMRDAVM